MEQSSPPQSPTKELLRRIAPLLAHQFSMLTISLLTLQPRAQLFMEALSGDTMEVAKYINRGTTLVGLLELFLNPSLGALSDRIGRKPIMLLAPVLVLPLKVAVVLRPSAVVLLWDKVLSDMLRTMGGTTMAYICYADLYQGEGDARTVAEFNTTASALGIVAAPLLSATLLRNRGPRFAYAVSAAIAGVHLVLAHRFLKETLHCRAPSAGELVSAGGPSGTNGRRRQSPILTPVWEFARLFTTNARLRLRAWLFTLHCCLEGKILQDQVSILQLGAGWAAELRSRWTAGFGFAMCLGGMLMQPLKRSLGEHGALSACHAASLLSLLALQQSRFWAALVPVVLAQQRRAASHAWLSVETCRIEQGRGRVVGMIASLRAVVDALTAMMYQRAYSAAVSKGNPFNIFVLPMIIAGLSEILRLRVARDRDVRLANGSERP
mmetsp:Transcript_177814/g.570246  ORF Transcript_177814/g.570246 Transcript_177814/m.570246 type:complete len:437 (+) Transcript_177814:87-1397(+)